MRLETAERFHRTKVKLSDIEDVFSEEEDKDRGEFVILRDDRGGFVQAAGEGDGPFMVEWKNAVDGAHYRSHKLMTRGQARDAFIAFFERDGDIWPITNWKRVTSQWREELVIGMLAAGAFLCWGMGTMIGPFNGWIESRAVLLGLKVLALALFLAAAGYMIWRDQKKSAPARETEKGRMQTGD
jgi:hypothetical protein